MLRVDYSTSAATFSRLPVNASRPGSIQPGAVCVRRTVASRSELRQPSNNVDGRTSVAGVNGKKKINIYILAGTTCLHSRCRRVCGRRCRLVDVAATHQARHEEGGEGETCSLLLRFSCLDAFLVVALDGDDYPDSYLRCS